MKRKFRELYRHSERISATFRQRRLKFYDHIQTLNNERPAKIILNRALSMKVKNNWLFVVESDLQEIGVTGEIVHGRSTFGALVDNNQFADKPKIRTNNPGQKRKDLREKMKRFWEKKKANTSVK